MKSIAPATPRACSRSTLHSPATSCTRRSAHFYVDRAHRGRGMGRALMDHALDCARRLGALVAWAETSNRNHPGVAAYERLGFTPCGFDLTLYSGTPSKDEYALFLARSLAPDDDR